jgi:DNA repair exonuclease SbcCD ATPase subunit
MRSLNEIKEDIKNLSKSVNSIIEKKDIPSMQAELDTLKPLTEEAGFWQDTLKAKGVMKRIDSIQDNINVIKELETKLSDLSTMVELYETEKRDLNPQELEELSQMHSLVSEFLDQVEVKTYLKYCMFNLDKCAM